MSQLNESFKEMAEFFVQPLESECLCFMTDTERYTFVLDKGLSIQNIQVGEVLAEEDPIRRCMREKKQFVDSYDKSVYGKRIKVFARPLIENGEVKGCYGILVHKIHTIERAFLDLAQPLAEAFPEGAFLLTTDLDVQTARQGSKKFDIPQFVNGAPVMRGTGSDKCMKSGQVQVINTEKTVIGIPLRTISVPLIDIDDQKVVGSFNLVLPQLLADSLHESANQLSANIQEIASVMEEVAASAGEISTNEGHLSDQVKEVAGISLEINGVLDFIKNVADQTKMLGLNAAIEAARAGEHGRGFGVVAEEIRRLSDQSKETTDRIRKLTKEIGDRINLIIEASEGTLRQSQEQAAATQEVTASTMGMAQMAEKLVETAKSL
jgi:hypothetical protein